MNVDKCRPFPFYLICVCLRSSAAHLSLPAFRKCGDATSGFSLQLRYVNGIAVSPVSAHSRSKPEESLSPGRLYTRLASVESVRRERYVSTRSRALSLFAGDSGRRRGSCVKQAHKNNFAATSWRSLSGCRVETRLDPRPDESGVPSGPCRHECLRHVVTAKNVKLFLRGP